MSSMTLLLRAALAMALTLAICWSGGDLYARPSRPSQPTKKAASKVRLKWGHLGTATQTDAAPASEEQTAADEKPEGSWGSWGSWAAEDEPDDYYIRLRIDEFSPSSDYSIHGFDHPMIWTTRATHGEKLGAEVTLAIEFGGNHLVSLSYRTAQWQTQAAPQTFFVGLGRTNYPESWDEKGESTDIGLGYAYEISLVRNFIHLELGGTLNYAKFHCEAKYNGSNRTTSAQYCPIEKTWAWGERDDYAFVTLTPTLHVGYRWFFLSLGGRLGIGTDTYAGMTFGYTMRY